MWREFLFKMGRSKRKTTSCSSDSDSEDSCDSDSSGISGHYSFHNRAGSSSNNEPTAFSRFGSQRSSFRPISNGTTTSLLMMDAALGEESCSDNNSWREKFEFTLSLIREPRYLLAETLVAEQLKLTLKQQAYRLEQDLLHQTIEELQQDSDNPRYLPHNRLEDYIDCKAVRHD